MAISLPGSVTGAAQTGFTTPGYTMSADTAPDSNGKQWACTALTGTQAGVTVHSVASPSTWTFVRPKRFRALGKANPVTGVIADVPRNVYQVLTRKGVLPLAGQPYATMIVRTTIEVPAGSDVADAANVKAALSLHIGGLSAISSGVGDTVLSGVM